MDLGFPEQFKELEHFINGWALATETERNRKRLSSPMKEIQAFYDAVLPQMEPILTYLKPYPLDEMPEHAEKLFYLCLSLAEVTTAVENYRQPSVIDGFESGRLRVGHEDRRRHDGDRK